MDYKEACSAIASTRAQPNHVICLTGNHEDLLLAAVDDGAWEEQWLHGVASFA